MKKLLLAAASLLASLSAQSWAANVHTAPDPWDNTNNVYQYLTDSQGNCLYPGSGGCNESGSKTVTRFSKGFRFQTNPYGLSATTSLDIDGDGVPETVSKYSGSYGTYTSKHYPVAVNKNGEIYFVFSGPVDLDGHHAYNGDEVTAVAEGGLDNVSGSSMFKNPDGNNQMQGYYITKYNPATKKVYQPVLIHVKGTDDPHDNAVLNFDDQGYVYVMIAGRAKGRGAFLFKSKSPYNIDDFYDVSPQNYNYNQAAIKGYTDFANSDGTPGYRPLAYPKFFWIPKTSSKDGYFRLIYTVYCGENCGNRNVFTAELHPQSGSTHMELSNVVRIANFLGHYAIANSRGQDVVVAFNEHLSDSTYPGGNVDNRTNIFYIHSTDGGVTWKNASNDVVNSSMPFDDDDKLDLVKAVRYYRDGSYPSRRVYLKDINFTGSGDNKHPIILYVGVVGTYLPNLTTDHYLAKAYFDGSAWISSRINNDVDHAYSSGSLVRTSEANEAFNVLFPKTPDSLNNGLAGGAIGMASIRAYYTTQNNGIYVTPAPVKITSSSDLDNLCEYNYIRGVYDYPAGSSVYAIAAGGNAYKYSDHNPIVIIETNGQRVLPQRFGPSDVDANGYVATTALTSCIGAP